MENESAYLLQMQILAIADWLRVLDCSLAIH